MPAGTVKIVVDAGFAVDYRRGELDKGFKGRGGRGDENGDEEE